MQDVINRTSPIPLYVQVSEYLEKEIKTEKYKVGDKLPSEGELAGLFQLNRNTIRQAMSLLVQKGLIKKQRGVGVFVKEKAALSPIHKLGSMVSFMDDFNLDNINLEEKIIQKEKIRAGEELAEKLMINADDEVVVIGRLRIADKTPLILEKQYYTFKDFGELLEMEIKGSMYQLLIDHFKADLDHSIQTIRAVKAEKEIARLMDISSNTPCIVLESLAYNSQNLCIEILQSFYRGDRYMFKVETGKYIRHISYNEGQ